MNEVIAHLQRQVESSRRLLGIVLAQTDAIKAQDVEGVLARLADVQAEMAVRQRLENERDSILFMAAERLGIDPGHVDLEGVIVDCAPAEAQRARIA